jgi:hypothetical protein
MMNPPTVDTATMAMKMVKTMARGIGFSWLLAS